jgi:hypothetical protein
MKKVTGMGGDGQGAALREHPYTPENYQDYPCYCTT